MTARIADEVLSVMKASGVPLRAKDIAEVFGWKYTTMKIAATLSALRRKGIVVKFSLPNPDWTHPGTGRMVNASGYAWMIRGMARMHVAETRWLAAERRLTNRAKKARPHTADMAQMLLDMENVN